MFYDFFFRFHFLYESVAKLGLFDFRLKNGFGASLKLMGISLFIGALVMFGLQNTGVPLDCSFTSESGQQITRGQSYFY